MKEIEEELEQDEELLLNVSSGTPAMKSSLMVLRSLTGIPCRVIQVTTPERKMNEQNHSDESIELLWEMDVDNDPSQYVDRTEEVECPWIIANQKKDLLRTQILSYDYEAALNVHRQMPLYKDGTYVKMLEAAAQRKMLNSSKVDEYIKWLKTNNITAFIPIQNSERRKVFEYAVSLDIRQKKKEYADFIRALTPLVLALFIVVVNKYTPVDLEEYFYYDAQEGTRRWRRGKLSSSPLYEIIAGDSVNPDLKNVYSWQILKIIQHYLSDHELCSVCADLRKIEERVRNIAAHEIVGISDNYIKEQSGFSSGEIMVKIRRVLFSADSEAQKHWNTYDEMNAVILARIGEELGV